MKTFFKTNLITILLFWAVALIGGFFSGLYALDLFPTEFQDMYFSQGNTFFSLGLSYAIYSAIIALVLGTLGIAMARRIGLWSENKKITKTPLIISIIVAIIAGAVNILPDLYYYARFSEKMMNTFAIKPTLPYLIGKITSGALVEEITLHLFWVSLIALILYKIFARKKEKPGFIILIISNIIVSLVFAVINIPISIRMLGFSRGIIQRGYVLYGGLSLLYGFLYSKFGFRYAMIAHAGCIIVSSILW